MIRLLKIDFRKFVFSKSFWILLVIYSGLVLSFLFGAEKVLNAIVVNANSNSPMPIPEFSIYDYPLIWHNLTFLGGIDIIKLLLMLLVVIFITNEFNLKTVRLNIMHGMSRTQFLFSKVMYVLLLSLFTTLVLFITGMILGSSEVENFQTGMYYEKITFLPAYFLEMLTFALLVLFLAFLIGRPIVSVALISIYYFLEWVLSFTLPPGVAKFLPFVAMRNIIDTPNSSIMKMFGVSFREYISIPDVLTCIVYCILFIGVIYVFIRKKDF